MSYFGALPIHRPRAGGRRPRRALFARTALCGVLVGGAAALASPALAIVPVGGPGLPVQANVTPQVNTGGAQPALSNTATEIDVTLHGARTVIDWDSFNLDAGN